MLRKLNNDLINVPTIDVMCYRTMEKRVMIGAILLIEFLGTEIKVKNISL